MAAGARRARQTAATLPRRRAPPRLLRRRTIYNCSLAGTLPANLFNMHPNILALKLSSNRLTGTLPAAWASSEARGRAQLGGTAPARLPPCLPPPSLRRRPNPRGRRPGLFAALRCAGAGSAGPGCARSDPACLPCVLCRAVQLLGSLNLDHNRLSGPAFPPAWLEGGRFNDLRIYDVSGNSQLTGTLPAALHWAKLNEV